MCEEDTCAAQGSEKHLFAEDVLRTLHDRRLAHALEGIHPLCRLLCSTTCSHETPTKIIYHTHYNVMLPWLSCQLVKCLTSALCPVTATAELQDAEQSQFQLLELAILEASQALTQQQQQQLPHLTGAVTAAFTLPSPEQRLAKTLYHGQHKRSIAPCTDTRVKCSSTSS